MIEESTAAASWRARLPLKGSLAEGYLAQHGVATASQAVAFEPAAIVTENHTVPAMLTAATNRNGVITAIERTFLDPTTGTALLWPPESREAGTVMRQTIGETGHSAVRLCAPASRLGLAPTVEIALAMAALYSIPVWATLGWLRAGQVWLPEIVEHVVVFIDMDLIRSRYDDGCSVAELVIRDVQRQKVSAEYITI